MTDTRNLADALSKATTAAYGTAKLAGHTATDAGLAVQADDPRLADARTPTAHAASHHTGGADALAPADIGAADAAAVTTALAGKVGTDDSRLTDARTPTSHNHAAADITSGVIAPARLGTGTANGTKVLLGDNTWGDVPSSVTDATTSEKGIVQLAGDLGGTAALPIVPGLAAKMANPMTAQDDLIIGGVAGAPARLAKGADGQVLTVDPATHHLVWATPSGGGGGGLTNPMIAQGDLIYGAPGSLIDRAQGKTVTSSLGTFDGSHTPAQAVDGNDATYYYASGGGYNGMTFAVDLAATYTVSSFRLLQHADLALRHATEYAIEYSDDGSTWAEAHHQTELAAVADTGRVVFPAQTARYWRFNGVAEAGGTINPAIYSFALYDDATTLGNPTRLPVGTIGQVLKLVDDGDGNPVPAWVTP